MFIPGNLEMRIGTWLHGCMVTCMAEGPCSMLRLVLVLPADGLTLDYSPGVAHPSDVRRRTWAGGRGSYALASQMQRNADAEGSIKTGWLNKKGKLNRSYQHRFFALWYQEEEWVAGEQVEEECFKLGYYKDANGAEPNGIIILQQGKYAIAAPANVTKGHEHGLELDGIQDGKRKHFTLSADTEQEQQEWITAIRSLKFAGATPAAAPEEAEPPEGAGSAGGASGSAAPTNTSRVGRKQAKKNAAASTMVGSIFELLDSDKDGFLNYSDFAGLGKAREKPVTLKAYLDLVQAVDGDVDTGLSEEMLADCYFNHSMGDCVADFERLVKLSGSHGTKYRQRLKRKSAGSASKTPRKQLDLGSIKPEELEEQRKLLEARVLEWLGDIPIGGTEERHYDPRPMCRFAESWNLFHLDVEEIYARQIDEQMAEAEVEAMVGSGRRRGEVMVDMAEVEEGRLLTVLIKANELVTQDRKMYITAKDLDRLLFHLRDRLGLPQEEDIFVTNVESGAEVLKLTDLKDHCSIKVWPREPEEDSRKSRSNAGGGLLEEDESSEEDDYQADPAASKAKLAEAAKVLWEAKYDADYKRGAALIVESNSLDKSALQARKMLEVAQRDGGAGASSVEMRVEALFVCLEADPDSMAGEATKLAAECMKLGNELLAIFDVTRDKDDTRRAEEYFKSACKLDPSVAEEADEGRQQAIAKRRSRRQRAANSAAERRRSVVEGANVRRRSLMTGASARRNSLVQGVSTRRNSILGGRSTGSPDTSPSAAAAGGGLSESSLSGPEGELEYMLRRGRASLPSQPKERQIRMVEMLQAAVVEWQAVVDAAEAEPPEAEQAAASRREEDQNPASQLPEVGGNNGGAKEPGPQKDGKRQRKKRGASSAAVVSTPGDEALGAFDALQALQSEQGWEQQRQTPSGAGKRDGSGSGEGDQGSATGSDHQLLADVELTENAEEEVETPRDDVRQSSQDIQKEGEEERADHSPDSGALRLGGLRSSRVSASDLGALGSTLEEGEEEED